MVINCKTVIYQVSTRIEGNSEQFWLNLNTFSKKVLQENSFYSELFGCLKFLLYSKRLN